jgi:hypothetical protein
MKKLAVIGVALMLVLAVGAGVWADGKTIYLEYEDEKMSTIMARLWELIGKPRNIGRFRPVINWKGMVIMKLPLHWALNMLFGRIWPQY